jgi:hypothetical protein
MRYARTKPMIAPSKLMTIVTFKLKINTRRAVIMRDIVKARDTL